jgi:type IV pilus assembly protein PilC
MLEWRFLAFCFILLLFTASVYLFIPACLIAAFVLIRLGGGYSAMHKRLLLWNLAAAGEAQVPLLPVLRATAEESPGRLQRAASYAANLVESGSVISTALARAWYWLSYDMRFALLAAEATSQFGSTLRQALSLEHRSRQQKQHVSEKLSYLSWVIFVVVMIVTFILLKIIPVIAKMFDDFGLELPAMTQLAIDISNYTVQKFWFIGPLVFLGSGTLVALFEPAIARWLAFFCPPLELLWMKRHGTTILRGMAVMVQHGRPLSEAFNVAAEQYPIAFVRGRLLAAKQRMQEGQAWPEVLRRSWFISRADAALLAAAERSNHLDWALESVADNIDRRLNLRVQFLASLIFPSILLVMSMFIAMIALAIMMPLISLTQGLAGGPARRR